MTARARSVRESMALALVAAALGAAGCARDAQPGTPEATAQGERLLREMSEALSAASVFSFATEESLEGLGPAEERSVLRFSRSVTVRRPDGLAFEVAGLAGTQADLMAHYDGTRVTLRDDLHGIWAETSAPPTIDEMLDDLARRYGLPVPIADVVYRSPYDAFIGPSTTGGFVGRETLDGTPCARLAYGDDLVDVRIWIPSAGPPLPRRVEIVYKQVPHAPAARIDFTRWDLAPRVDSAVFTPPPGDAATRVPFEALTARLLAGGEAVPAAALDAAAAPLAPAE